MINDFFSDKSTHQNSPVLFNEAKKNFNVLVRNSFIQTLHLFRFLFPEYIWFLDQAVMGGTGVQDLDDTLKNKDIRGLHFSSTNRRDDKSVLLEPISRLKFIFML